MNKGLGWLLCLLLAPTLAVGYPSFGYFAPAEAGAGGTCAANQVWFLNAAGTLVSCSTNLTWDDTNKTLLMSRAGAGAEWRLSFTTAPANRKLWSGKIYSVGTFSLQALDDTGVAASPAGDGIQLIRGTSTLANRVIQAAMGVTDAVGNQTQMFLKNTGDMIFFTQFNGPGDGWFQNTLGCSNCSTRFNILNDTGAVGATGQVQLWYVSSLWASGTLLTGGFSSPPFFSINTSAGNGAIEMGSNGAQMLSMSADSNTEKLRVGATPVTYVNAVNAAGVVTATIGDNLNVSSVTNLVGGSAANTQANGVPMVTQALTAPTISSGFGTAPSVTSNAGAKSFSVNIGTGGTASAGVVGLPAAPNHWACSAYDETTAANLTLVTAPVTTSTITLTNYNRTTGVAAAWTASDIVDVSCWAN